MIRYLTFDLDGTLWDSNPALLRAERAVHAWVARRWPRAAALPMQALVQRRRDLAARRPDIVHDVTRLRHTSLAELARDHGYDPAAADEAMDLFLHERSRVELYDDTLAALADLASRYRLVAVTNGNADVARIGVAEYFDFVVTPAAVGAAKPDPKVFEYVLRRSGAPSSAMVHVGDEPVNDMQCARDAGVAGVWVNRTGVAWPDMPAPHAQIASLAELPGVLARLTG
ncbi:MAG: HAD family hydrolase [Gammaproteobacteria bacterium]